MKIEGIEDEVNKLEAVLTPFINKIYDNINLEKKYEWSFEYDKNIFSENEINELNTDNKFNNNVNLKFILNKKLDDNNCDKDKLYKWIIKWGKIRNFQKDNKEIDLFLEKLEKHINIFPDTISSLSKIASFKYLNKYFIYDAHVSYVLNWLLLKSDCNENIKYFPMKESKNKNISKNYNMDTILTLTNKKIEFYERKTYYFIYCKLIQSITEKNKKFKEPFYLEMMLFSIIDIIVDEIKDKVKISIEK
jgi:hypothetical protein